MSKMKLSAENKRLDTDLWIIVLVSLAALGAYIIWQKPISAAIKDSTAPVLPRVLLGAAFQFGLAGLGITAVALIRRESFLSHGLRRKGAVLSVALCALCFVPYLLFLLATKQLTGYLPFYSVWTTKDVLSSAFPVNILGMLITAVAWGFFEGFNYVVISDKINKRFPSKSRWLNKGAIVCAVFCILIHGAVGVTAEGILEMLTVAFIIYGMLLVKEYTGNAWGCVAIFVLLWNAL